MRLRGLTGLLVLSCTALLAASTVVATPLGHAVEIAPLDPAVQIDALSCPAAGQCTAIGTYADGLGHGQGLLLTQKHGVWGKPLEAPLPANASSDPLKLANNTGITDVSCPAVGDCSAVGIYTDKTNNDRGLLLSERHGRWARGVEAKLPGGAVTSSKSKKGAADDLVIISDACVSVGNCYAVGDYVSTSNTLPALIVAERNGKWQRGTVAPLPPGATVRGQRAVLYAITCLPTGSCTATGAYTDANGAQQGMMLTETGGVWNATTEASLPATAGTSPVATPIAVACAAVGDCAVAGNYQDGNDNSLGLLLSESNSTWAAGTQATLPANAAPPTSYNAQTTDVISVACADAQDCAAVGSYTDSNGNTQALLVNQASGAWQPGQEVTLPTDAIVGNANQLAVLDTVSCASAGNCVAGGVYTDTAQNFDSLLVTETNGVWARGIQVPLPRGAAQQEQFSAVTSVKCQSVGICAVVGSYTDYRGETFGYSLSETGGVWSRTTMLAAPPVTRTELKLAVHQLLKPTGKDARVAAIRHAGSFDQTYVMPKPGTMTLSWYQTDDGKQVLIATGHVRDRIASKGELVVRLTAAGHALFNTGAKLTLTAVAGFKPKSGQTISARGSFTLK